MKSWEDFIEYWVVDYEFISKKGNPQIPICYVAKNLNTEEFISHWIDGTEEKPEYSIDNESLFIAYYASAEIGCHIPLGFKSPVYILDLFSEFRCLTNGIRVPAGNSLIGACAYYGLSGSDASYKDAMRDRILQGYPYSEEKIKDILEYCRKDVEITANLFSVMKKEIDLPYSLLRGRYMADVAKMEYFGIPIDTKSLADFRKYWDYIKEELICRVDKDYNVYEGTIFKIAKFKDYLEKNQIPWDYTPTGLPTTDNDYMRKQAKIHPELLHLQELRYTIGQLKLNDLQVGDDGRNRCLLSPFRSKTSRNQPSSSKFIFGNAKWIRKLIKPPEGMAISYIDYEQQELGIAAALSGDKNLIAAYNSGDPYLAFAKTAGAIPESGTKSSHLEIREKFKTCMLALNYGMSTKTFAARAKIPLAEAKAMVKSHKRNYHKYWEWNSSFVDIAMLTGMVKTKFNWYMKTGIAKNRTLMNWPMQSHGADMLRLAISLCMDNGVRVIAPVHDAILVESSAADIDSIVRTAQCCMEEASVYVIDFKLRTEANTIRYPDRYIDPRGELMWKNVWDIINDIKTGERET